MKSYIGTKIIQATPAINSGVEGYHVMYPDGYVSWSPRDTFEQCYREISDLEIELLAAKQGSREELGVKIPEEDPRTYCETGGHKWRKVPEWANEEICSVCDVRRSRVE